MTVARHHMLQRDTQTGQQFYFLNNKLFLKTFK